MADASDELEVLDPETDAEEVALNARREARAAIPATYVDTWATQIWKDHMRIVLGEWLSGGPHYRAAFVMELDDVQKLAEHILRRVQRQRQRDAAKAKAERTSEGNP